jgi:hypothetical protein
MAATSSAWLGEVKDVTIFRPTVREFEHRDRRVRLGDQAS